MKRFTTIVNCIGTVGMIFLGWSASDAVAGAVYVATNGNDNSLTGSIDFPFATPARALEAAKAPGIDAIYLRARASDPASRRYVITQTLSITKAGLTIATHDGDLPLKAAIIAGTKINGPQSVIAVYASGVTIKNLEIQGGAYYGIKLDDANGAQTDQKIIGNYIHHTGRDGIKAQRADRVVIENNEIGPTGVRDASNAEGIDMIGSIGATIRGNYIHDITTNGLYVKGGTKDAVVEKNLVVNTGFAGILLGSETDAEFIRNDGDNGGAHEALNSVARNNIVVNTAMAGLGTIAGKNVSFLNNTLVNVARTNQGGFRAAPNQHGTEPSAIVFKNNVVILDPASTRPLVYLYKTCDLISNHNLWFSDGGPSNFVLDSTSCGSTTYFGLDAWQGAFMLPGGVRMNPDEHSVDGTEPTHPPRLDPTDLYRPLSGSAVIGAGETVPNNDDYLGVLRPINGSYDIGAHEGVATTRVVPVAPSALDAIARSATRVELAWSDGNSTDTQTGFRIERSTDGGATFTVIGTAAPTAQGSFVDTDVTGNATYHYRVAAYNGRSISPYSNVDSVKTPRR